jgi:hypothetical protein
LHGGWPSCAARDRRAAARVLEGASIVLDVLCILGIIALGVTVALVGKAVEKL